jgi:hypothetical protein
MMKHYFFEILLKILKILSIKKNVLIHRLNLAEYEFLFYLKKNSSEND